MSSKKPPQKFTLLYGGRTQVSDPILDRALASLKEEVIPECQLNARFDRGVDIVDSTIKSYSKVRVRRVAITSATLAAAAVLALLVSQPRAARNKSAQLGSGTASEKAQWTGEVEGRALHRTAGGSKWLPTGKLKGLKPGDTLKTEEATARVPLASGAKVELARGTSVIFPEGNTSVLSSRIQLLNGTLTLTVPPLPAGLSLVVEAGRDRVIVHGTEFTVTLTDESVAACVIVQSGDVEVRGLEGSIWLRAGQQTGCAPSPTEQDQASSLEQILNQGDQKGARIHRKKTSTKLDASDLAQQNRLFQDGLAAMRAGNSKGAQKYLLTLLSEYPQSPLATQARVELKRAQAMEKNSGP